MNKPTCILVVDDDPSTLRNFAALLRGAGYEVLAASTGREGLQLCRERRPEICLLDVMMPDISGLEVCRRLKDDPALADIFVVLTSGPVTRGGQQLGGTDQCADAYMLKSADGEEFLARFRTFVRLQATTTALRANERNYRQLAENIREVFWITDAAKNTIIYVSPGYAEIWGRTCESLYASPRAWVDAIHTDDRERVLAAALTKQVTGEYHEVYRIQRPDGSMRWIEDRAFPIRDSAGKVERVVGVADDVTERKRAEQRGGAVSRLGYRLSAANTREQAAEIILEIGSELFGWDAGYVSLYSAEADRMTPLLVVDTVGDTRKRFPPSSAALDPSPLMRRIMSGGAELLDPAKAAAAGLKLVAFGNVERRAAIMMFAPIRVRNSVIGLVSIQSYRREAYDQQDLATLQTMADVCGGALQRIEITEALRVAEAKYRSIFENSTDGIFQTSHEGRYLNANPALARMFGYQSPDELIAAVSNIESLTFVSPERARELKQALAASDSLRGFEAERYRKDGARIWTSINVTKVRNPDGTLSHYEGTVQDITERKRGETESAALSRLGYGLSAAITSTEAATMVLDVASELFGWDAGYVHLHSKTEDKIIPVLTVDTINGKRGPVEPTTFTLDPSPLMRLVMERGPQLYDRTRSGDDNIPPLISFGNANRPSACMMYVPIRAGKEVFGILSIQSYAPHAYRQNDLNLLQTIADYCGDTFRRIEVTEQLRQAETKYRSIFEHATEGIFQSTPDGRLIAANQALAKMFGFESPEQMMAEVKHLARELYVLPEMRGEFLRLLESQGAVQGFEAEGRRKDGSRLWVAVNARVVTGKHEGERFYEGTARDITSRKRLEKNLIAFTNLGHRLSAATGMEEAARIILEIANDLFGWDSGYVHLYSEKDDKIIRVLTLDTVEGLHVSTPPARPTADPSPMMRLVMRDGPRLIRRGLDPDPVENFYPFGNPARLSASMMYVPIRTGGGVIGIMSVQSYTELAYTVSDLQLLQVMADHCGDALQRVRVAEALLAAELKYRGIFENATEGIFQSTPDGRMLGANPALARMLGYESTEQLISSVTDIARQIYGSMEKRSDFKLLIESQASVQGFEVENYRKDGSKIWITINARAVRDFDGRVIFYEGTIQDITRNRQTEATLRESERKLRLISENATDAIFAFDMDRRPVYGNPAVAWLTGYPFAEILERGFINWIHPDDQDQMLKLWEALFKGHGYSEVEFRLITRTGQTKWCSSSWGPLFDEAGCQIGVQGRERDITQRKQLETEVVEISAQERRRIGHELHDGLCQYLAGIAFRAKALEQNLQALNPAQAEDAKELVALMGQAVSQARNLARGMAPVDVEGNGLAPALQTLAAETKHFFNTPCEVVIADPDLQIDSKVGLELYRIAQEAIYNAVKHGEAARIEVSLKVEDQTLSLRIVDNGKGFENENNPASGMGLRVMAYRARSVGGNVKVTSHDGHGTEVVCTIPINGAVPGVQKSL